MKKVLRFPELNRKVVIKQDSDVESPRKWDNVGKCIFFHRSYDIGDKHDINANDYNSFDEMEQGLIKGGAKVILPVYMYDHSGITIQTTPYGDRWDSGHLGFIVAYKEAILNCFPDAKIVTKKIKEKVKDYLLSEINTLDQYITNEVYYFKVKEISSKDELDSCHGFYGDTFNNGIFDHLDIDGLTLDKYKEVFETADWE